MFNKKDDLQIQETSNDSFYHTMQDDLKNTSSENNNFPQTEPENNALGNIQTSIPKTNFSEKSSLSNDNPFFTPSETVEKTKTLPTENISPQKPLETPELPKNFENKQFSFEEDTSPTQKPWIRVAIIGLIIFIVLIIIGGGYVFWMTRQTSTEMENVSDQTTTLTKPEEAIAEEPVNINPVLEKYSTENPNIISIDIDSTTDQDIKNLLINKASDVASMQIKKPVEFIITDKNNTPIAFPIFALAAKITFSQNLLSNLEEKFSLYMFPESFGTRVGLTVNLKNKDLVLTKMLEQEKTLIQDLSLLFLENKPENITNPLFKDGKYNDLSIRYLNLNQTQTLSIDYTITDKQLIVGTSKDTLRAIVDKVKISSDSAAPTTTPNLNETVPAPINPETTSVNGDSSETNLSIPAITQNP